MMRLLALATKVHAQRLLHLAEVALAPQAGHKAKGITKFYKWAVRLNFASFPLKRINTSPDQVEHGATQLARYIESTRRKKEE